MSTFPDKESEVTTLATTMIGGLTNNTGIFNNTPVLPAAIQTALTDFNDADTAATQAQSIAQQRTGDKVAALKILIGLLRQVLNYAENIPNITDAQLKLLGWGKPSARKPLEMPGQCANFVLVSLNGNLADFDWSRPRGGGKPAGYKLMKRAVGSTEWTLHDVATRDEDETTLPTGHWEVAVVAFNDAGTGPLSNSVTVLV